MNRHIQMIRILSVSAMFFGILSYSYGEVIDVRKAELIHEESSNLPKRMRFFANSARSRAATKPWFSKHTENTLKVLAIRVDFPPPRELDDCGISGNGEFDLSGEDSDDRDIGMPPHNKRYFERMLEALSHYYKTQTYGAIDIEYRVLPDGDNAAYRMPQYTAYYSYPSDPTNLSKRETRLVELFEDAIYAADEDSTVLLGDYDTYIVFHAGGDWQHDFNGDSPCDLITAYIPSIAAFQDEPLFVDNGNHSIDDGIVMPEAINQDLDPNEALAGIQSELAHEFGHQLGALDLYDYNFWSNIVGYWALMDNGDGMAFQDEQGRIISGVLPPSLCAFTKTHLGWVDPVELHSDGQYSIPASTVSPTYFRITINDHEEFLIENRQVSTDEDPVVYLKTRGGIVLGPTTETGDTISGEYDAGLPGSGILIWHIDTAQGAWENGLPNFNTIDAVADTLIRSRGVALEEADGIENIGIRYLGDYYIGYWPSADPGGSEGDPFGAGHNDHFGASTRPASWDNSGRRSHIEISDISESAGIMSFRFSRSWYQEGWPAQASVEALSEPNYVTWNGSNLILAAGGDVVHAFDAFGERIGSFDLREEIIGGPAAYESSLEEDFFIAVSGAEGSVGLFTLNEPGAGQLLDGWPVRDLNGMLSPPLIDDLNGDGNVEVVVGTSDGRIHVFDMTGNQLAGWGTVFAEGSMSSPACVDLNQDGEKELVLTVLNQGLHVFTLDGEYVDGWPREVTDILSDPLISDCDDDGSVEIFVTGAQTAWLFRSDGSLYTGWPVTLSDSLSTSTAVCDADGDGILDYTVLSSSGTVVAWSKSGAPIADAFGHYPRNIPYSRHTYILSMNMDNDDRNEFIVGAADIRGIDDSGSLKPGWPLTLDGGSGGICFDLDTDDDLELVTTDSLGRIHVWDLPYPTETLAWGLPRGDIRRSGWAGSGNPVSWTQDNLISVADFYCWPNPVEGSEAHLSFRAQSGSTVDITVLDAAGNKRTQWSGTASGQRDEWIWSADVPTGVYLYHITAKLDGSTQTNITQFAVLR